MKNLPEKDLCTGCGCCAISCSQKAILMNADDKGFAYPIINQDLCVNCGICGLKCPTTNKKFNTEANVNNFFAVKHRSDTIRENSSSGGIFTALSDEILKDNGSVYGAAYNKAGKIEHARATNNLERDYMRGSKYSQSDIVNMFSLVKDDLSVGKKVLFTGTPCQIAALYNYLGERAANLFTCDIICHGVLSPKLFVDFQKLINTNKKRACINFRDKQYGWKAQEWTIKLANKKTKNKGYIKNFKRLYTRNLAIRESCFNCIFATKERQADITISDYWGIAKLDPHFEDPLGVNMLWTHTNNGVWLFEKCKENIYWIKGDEASAEQPQMLYPTTKPIEYDSFWAYNKKYGIKKTLKKYGNVQIAKKFYMVLKNIFRVNKKGRCND